MEKGSKGTSFVTLVLGTIGAIAGVTAAKPITVLAPPVEPTEAVVLGQESDDGDAVVVTDKAVLVNLAAGEATARLQTEKGEENVREDIVAPQEKQKKVSRPSKDEQAGTLEADPVSSDDELRSIVEGNHRAYAAVAAAKEKETEEAMRRFVKEENDRARRAITTITIDPDDLTPCPPPDAEDEPDYSDYPEYEDESDELEDIDDTSVSENSIT